MHQADELRITNYELLDGERLLASGNSRGFIKALSPWLAVATAGLMMVVCLGASWLSYRQIELFHAAFVYGCAFRSYQIHYQDPRKYPDPFRYDFIGSPATVVLVTVWVKDGPALDFNRILPLGC
jgi:hypothetical protein